MRLGQRPLLPIFLLVFLLTCGITIAGARMTQESGQNSGAGCTDSCKDRLSKTLERCATLPDASRERCRDVANNQYNKCLERCGD